ncbi:MAG: TVP38/TMEM64 family protein [Deltaproteobacteria bacterium]|nr:TVP38/TMEM64 family protein [Deltaproteobacteria bacterium]
MTIKIENILKFAAFFVFAGTVGYLLFLTPVGSLCLSQEGRKELVARIDFYVQAAGVFGPGAFVLFYGLGVLALPATPFTAAGALIFGKYLGAAYNILGAVAGASISFLLGRYFLRGFAEGFLVGKLADLDRKAEEHGFAVVFYLRILWFPFIVLNYAAGATRIRFSDYFWGTILGIAPAVAIVSFFVGNLKEIVASFRGPADLFQFNILFPAALLAFSFFLPGIVRRIRKDRPAGATPADGRGHSSPKAGDTPQRGGGHSST